MAVVTVGEGVAGPVEVMLSKKNPPKETQLKGSSNPHRMKVESKNNDIVSVCSVTQSGTAKQGVYEIDFVTSHKHKLRRRRGTPGKSVEI